MPRIEVNTIKAGNYAYYFNVLNYVAKDDKCIQGYIGASNLLLPNKRSDIVKYVSHQVEMARMHYGQDDRRLGLHCIFEFTPGELEYLSPV